MSKLLYLDILRMASPGDVLESNLFDFYVFGTFDAIKVETMSGDIGKGCTFQELHLISKQRRLKVPSHYDKQSMHLYSPNDSAELIFAKGEKYASWPLVLTLIQLDDYSINKDTPDQLVTEFKNYIDSFLNKDGIGVVRFEVFFCLGEPDIVVAFRNNHLSDIARLIYRIRLWGPFEQNDPQVDKISVLSLSSHCAFPNALSDNSLKSNLEKWITGEKNIKFFTMLDSSYGLDNNIIFDAQTAKKKFRYKDILLGEWDYIYKWHEQNDIVNNLTEYLFQPLTNFDVNETGFFKTSYSIPVIGLQEEDMPFAESDRKIRNIHSNDFLNEYLGKKTTFYKLSKKIKNLIYIYGSAKECESLSNIVDSMQSTLVGILKYLQQLKDGRFQYDLYAFVIPAFEALPHITNNIITLISQIESKCLKVGVSSTLELQKAGKYTICDLLDCYIHDLSRLLTELQHLFSVLSISPHTYLESYGSNMRSITATCKLLVAYQGIAYSLSKHFQMELEVGRRIVQANEVMLVIPYRRIRQSTRVLFERSSPENRIVYIRINASDMFDVQKTLFMLLHECGHHVLNRNFRKERLSYYFNAYGAYLLDQVFGAVYCNPYRTIQEPLYSNNDYQKGISMPKIHIKNKSEEEISETIINFLREQDFLENEFEEYWKREYKKLDRVKALAEPITLKNALLVNVQESVCAYIEGVLKELRDNKDSESFCQINPFSEYITWLLKNGIIDQYVTVLDEEYQTRFDKDDDELWCLSEIRTIYRTFPEELIKGKVQTFCFDIVEKLYRSVAEELKMIFSDIYSDVFAFSMLRTWTLSSDEKEIEARKYIALIRDEAGFQIKDEFDHSFLLVRLLAVLEVCFDIPSSESGKLIVNVLSLPYEDSESISKNLKFIRNQVGFTTVLNYTKELCVRNIYEQINGSSELTKDTQELFNMYHNVSNKDKIESLINAVFYFWKASTKRV